MSKAFVLAVLGGLCLPMLGQLSSARAEMLISADEAALPAAGGGLGGFRGVTRGPRVQSSSPATEGTSVASPVDLRVKFESFGGATVDLASVKVTYLKTPSVDLTPRVKAFVKPTGIEMPTAELPPGEHPIRIEFKDSEGRTAQGNFTLKVSK